MSSCATCKDPCKATQVQEVCKVCSLNDKDDKVKKVCWCDTCNAYICEKHWGQPFERFEAAVRNVGNKIVKLIKKP